MFFIKKIIPKFISSLMLCGTIGVYFGSISAVNDAKNSKIKCKCLGRKDDYISIEMDIKNFEEFKKLAKLPNPLKLKGRPYYPGKKTKWSFNTISLMVPIEEFNKYKEIMEFEDLKENNKGIKPPTRTNNLMLPKSRANSSFYSTNNTMQNIRINHMGYYNLPSAKEKNTQTSDVQINQEGILTWLLNKIVSFFKY